MGGEVRLLIDASALAVYASLSGLAPGEVLGEVEDIRGAVLGIPVTSFVKAYAEAKSEDRYRLVELVLSPERSVRLLALRGIDGLPVAELLDLHDEQLAHCIVEARNRQVLLATYDVENARRSLDEDLILELVEP